MDFTGFCAVVTGGESGIGHATAMALGKAGASVAVTCFLSPRDDCITGTTVTIDGALSLTVALSA